MPNIKNPILKGFNPDPSIIFNDGYYYIATSTFQWFPGVQVHRSVDLVNWEFVTRPLDSIEKLNMAGIPDSGGIWAPCLSYEGGRYYLIFTNVISLTGIFKDTHNYLVTAENIKGPWSAPKYLNSLGFDPSLFHDKNGKKYLLNTLWDHRPWMENYFKGITIQEYDFEKSIPLGERKLIYRGTGLKLTEGPHLYQKDDFYYLFTAEGGTRFSHAETVSRSKDIFGPYETHPQNPLITSRNYPDISLQKSGHGDVIQTNTGKWYLVHLASRPEFTGGKTLLGRETAIQELSWPENGWPRIAAGGNEPRDTLYIDSGEEQKEPESERNFSFNESLPEEFQSLRVPMEGNFSLQKKPGCLRMYGRESMGSLFNQSLFGIRQDSPVFDVSVQLDFQPDNFHQMAGLSAYYDCTSYYYLHLSHDEHRGRVLHLLMAATNSFDYPHFNLKLPETGKVNLRYRVDKSRITFYYSMDQKEWVQLKGDFSTELLSDEFSEDYRFTGAFAALACQDLTGLAKHADFNSLKIKTF